MELLKPVYLKDKEIQCGQNRISDYDLSIAVSNIINDVKCVQKDRDLWRIYVDSTESRSQLLAQGIDLRNTNIRVYHTNPYSAGISSPSENVLKITVKGVPLSVDDNEVIKMLNDFNVSFTSELKYEKIRHPITRKMTGILNGNRFIYAKSLAEGTFLPRTATCAGLRCFIYHYGQPSAKRTPRCTNCWEEHHFSKDCPNPKRCKVCKSEGHMPGDKECEFFSQDETNVIAFAGQDNCLSNFYPCNINVFGVSHRSAEHAFQYVKAMRSGDIPRATAIQSAKSALDAKKIGKFITSSTSFTDNQVALMTEIIEAKADQVPAFADALKKYKKSDVFVETTFDDFWASGLDRMATIHTHSSAWPGSNKLGHIISEIASRMRRATGRSHSAPRTAPKEKTKSQSNISQMLKELKNPRKRSCSGSRKSSPKSQVRDSKKRDGDG